MSRLLLHSWSALLEALTQGLFRPGRPWHTLLAAYLMASAVGLVSLLLPRSAQFDASLVIFVILTGPVLSVWIAWRRDRLSGVEQTSLLVYATAAVTAVDLLSGSAASPFVSLQIWPVLTAALLLPRGALFLVTALAVGGAFLSIGLGDRSGDGLIRVLVLSVTLIVTALATRRGVRQVRTLLAQLEAQTRTDALTGLLNRRAFDEQLTQEVGLAARGDTMFSLAILDVDTFKAVNDAGGHAAGDATLRSVAEALRGRLRATDEVFRVGGDEFAVLLRGCDAEAAVLVLQDAVYPLRKRAAPLTLSGGIAGCPESGCDERTLMSAADSALYAAKQAGRDRLRVAPPHARTLRAGQGR